MTSTVETKTTSSQSTAHSATHSANLTSELTIESKSQIHIIKTIQDEMLEAKTTEESLIKQIQKLQHKIKLLNPAVQANYLFENLGSPYRIQTAGPLVRVDSSGIIYRPVVVIDQHASVTERFHAKYPELQSWNNLMNSGFLVYIMGPDKVLTWDAAIMHQAASSDAMASQYIQVFNYGYGGGDGDDSGGSGDDSDDEGDDGEGDDGEGDDGEGDNDDNDPQP